MSIKRKHVMISLKQKLEAVNRINAGELLKNVAADYGVGASTVSDWVKQKSKLEKHLPKMPPNRKTMKPAKYEKLDEAVYFWFTKQRKEENISLSAPAIQEKARMFAAMLGRECKNFNASLGWLSRWKKRYNICEKGEKLSSNQGFINVVNIKIEDLVNEPSFKYEDAKEKKRFDHTSFKDVPSLIEINHSDNTADAIASNEVDQNYNLEDPLALTVDDLVSTGKDKELKTVNKERPLCTIDSTVSEDVFDCSNLTPPTSISIDVEVTRNGKFEDSSKVNVEYLMYKAKLEFLLKEKEIKLNEKKLAVEERKLALEERKLAFQERKLALIQQNFSLKKNMRNKLKVK